MKLSSLLVWILSPLLVAKSDCESTGILTRKERNLASFFLKISHLIEFLFPLPRFCFNSNLFRNSFPRLDSFLRIVPHEGNIAGKFTYYSCISLCSVFCKVNFFGSRRKISSMILYDSRLRTILLQFLLQHFVHTYTFKSEIIAQLRRNFGLYVLFAILFCTAVAVAQLFRSVFCYFASPHAGMSHERIEFRQGYFLFLLREADLQWKSRIAGDLNSGIAGNQLLIRRTFALFWSNCADA